MSSDDRRRADNIARISSFFADVVAQLTEIAAPVSAPVADARRARGHARHRAPALALSALLQQLPEELRQPGELVDASGPGALDALIRQLEDPANVAAAAAVAVAAAAAAADDDGGAASATHAAAIAAGVDALKLLRDTVAAGAPPQHTTEWKRARQLLITASLAHRALGEALRRTRGPLTTAYALPEDEVGWGGNDATREGQNNEPEALRRFADLYGGWVVVGASLVVSRDSTPDLPLGGSVDALWVAPRTLLCHVLEVKTLTTDKEMHRQGPPPAHSTQMQVLMHTFKLARAVYIQSRSRCGRDDGALLALTHARDDGWWGYAQPLLRSFWAGVRALRAAAPTAREQPRRRPPPSARVNRYLAADSTLSRRLPLALVPVGNGVDHTLVAAVHAVIYLFATPPPPPPPPSTDVAAVEDGPQLLRALQTLLRPIELDERDNGKLTVVDERAAARTAAVNAAKLAQWLAPDGAPSVASVAPLVARCVNLLSPPLADASASADGGRADPPAPPPVLLVTLDAAIGDEEIDQSPAGQFAHAVRAAVQAEHATAAAAPVVVVALDAGLRPPDLPCWPDGCLRLVLRTVRTSGLDDRRQSSYAVEQCAERLWSTAHHALNNNNGVYTSQRRSRPH